MEQCLEHQNIKRNTDLIPDMREKVEKIHDALLGDLEKPGFISRLANAEKQLKIIMRVAYGVISIGILSIIATVLNTAGLKVWNP